MRSLRSLADDETLLVQSGKPVGILKTHPEAPRVLLANSLLVPRWANWGDVPGARGPGLTMYGQMTAGSWIYIGTQGSSRGPTRRSPSRAAALRGIAARDWTLTAGLGGMGGAQPLAVTMNEGICLAVEVDPERVERRLATRYLDRASADEALGWVEEAVRARRAVGRAGGERGRRAAGARRARRAPTS